MSTRWHPWLCSVVCLASAARLWAGGSGLNVVIVVNQGSTNSVLLGNYYREQRQVPPQNVLRINWPGGNTLWTLEDFNTYLLSPLQAMLSSRQLTNQVDYIVLSMDIPYRVSSSTSVAVNSTTSALFYGFKPDSNPPCSKAPGSTSLYAGSEGIFRSTPPISATSNSYLACMITSSNLALARQIVDSGVTSDGSFPTQTVYLAKSSDVDRNVRFVLFDNAIFNTRLRGNYTVQRLEAGGIGAFGSILGAETGAYSYGVSGTVCAPGGMVDNLTSYGGLLFENSSGQLDILSLLSTGAAGSYGTVDEPCNYLEKFPSPQNYFYQARGFSLAECYYQSVTNPYQGLLVGEPLAAPFAQPGSGAWLNLPANAVLSGTTNLSVRFTASDTNHPLQQIDLFLDGQWLQTLTNIAPRANNVLYVKLNDYTTNYAVAAGETIQSVVSALAARLNRSTYANQTHVTAIAHGDRIELQSTDISKTGSRVSLSVSNYIGSASALTTYLCASGSSFVDTVAYGRRNFQVNGSPTATPPLGAWLLLTITKTNGTVVRLGVTNSVSDTTVAQMVSTLVNQVNAAAQLTPADGCTAQDYIDHTRYGASYEAEFNLLPRTPGWNPAQIQVQLQGSPPLVFSITPSGTQKLDENLADLEPRAHLYVTAGLTNLPVTFAFNTSTQANGYHELTAVAYEGSHVRTQTRATQSVVIQNGPLSATLTSPYSGMNVAVEAPLPFTVTANTNNVARIELFSTGGSLTNVSGQSSATFAVTGTNLDLGLHPFYAIVTLASAQQYRTQTKWFRLVGPDSPFAVSITAPPARLSWPATAGRSYDVLSTTNLANAFQPRANLAATNSPAQWGDTSGTAPQRFYRVRTSP